MSDIQKKSVGRPAVNATPVTLRLPPEILTPLDKFASDEADNPGRPESIRRILKDWLIRNGYLKG